jgi:uncharacterized protein
VISDNHGCFDPDVLEIFAGVGHSIHAGGTVDAKIIATLEAVAAVTAVSGNLDTSGPAAYSSPPGRRSPPPSLALSIRTGYDVAQTR